MLELAAHIPHQQLQGMAVAVLLGSSLLRPREVYCMHFPPAMHTPGEAAPHYQVPANKHAAPAAVTSSRQAGINVEGRLQVLARAKLYEVFTAQAVPRGTPTM